MDVTMRKLLRQLPSVDELINLTQKHDVLSKISRKIITEAARKVINNLRLAIINHEIDEVVFENLYIKLVDESLALIEGNLRKVINGTGVVLHTNLGRALLSKGAQEAIQRVAGSYSNLELNLETGNRGSRYSHVEELLTTLTGAEAALVVNNNASAVLLALSAMAKEKEVIVSRGQLVEIGGAFRIPDVMVQSGATLIEVGTTNKTHKSDYEAAISTETALLLKVHTSNYKVIGFTHETSLDEIVTLGKVKGIPVMEDLGSGSLFRLKDYGIGDEPTVQECVKAGADIVTFSGDKLLGGPQAGIIVGKKEFIDLMKKHPLTRALRIDKFTVAALEATLIEYLDPEAARVNIPILNMLTMSLDEITERAHRLSSMLKEQVEEDKISIDLAQDYSQVGGGALPTVNLPTIIIRLRTKLFSATSWTERLRRGRPALLVRVKDDHLLIDPRTLLQEEFELLVKKIKDSLN